MGCSCSPGHCQPCPLWSELHNLADPQTAAPLAVLERTCSGLLAQTTMAQGHLAASSVSGWRRLSPCSRTVGRGGKCLQATWLPGLSRWPLGLCDSNKEYVVAGLPRLIWSLRDLPCGLWSPTRKSGCCAARWFHFFSGRLISSHWLALASEEQVLMATNELSLVPSWAAEGVQ